MKIQSVTTSNKATATRIAHSVERALQTENGAVEVIPGVELPTEAAARFIEIAKADDDKASDGDLSYNLSYYVQAAVLDYIAANSPESVTPRFSL